VNARLAFAMAFVIAVAPTSADAKQPPKRHGSLSFASLPSCRAAALSLRFIGGQAAMGHDVLAFSLKNTSSSTCATSGYPRVLFFDKAGKPLATTPVPTTHDFFDAAPLQRLMVVPGAIVSFRLVATHDLTPAAGCAIAFGLQVILPNDAVSLRTSIANGVYECRRTTVSPLQTGDTAARWRAATR